MRRSHAVLGSALFFLLAPGVLGGLVPWLITHWETDTPVLARIAGVALIVVGVVPALAAFVEFARAGGTPAPVAPTQRLVVSGFNRYVRNPMYLGVFVAIAGQAVAFGSLGVLAFGLAALALAALFVRLYEEPTLRHRYGAEYEAYRNGVHAWLPHLHAYRPGTG
jgi:protein-S-isoprenylcysteine O-methyltransferase Ste14